MGEYSGFVKEVVERPDLTIGVSVSMAAIIRWG